MKIMLTADLKKTLTSSEKLTAGILVRAMEEEETDVKEYAAMAARVAAGTDQVTVLEASAEVAKNERNWNGMFNESANFDVWVNFTAYAGNCFVIGGAYLSDIWEITGRNNAEILDRMFIRKFVEVTK